MNAVLLSGGIDSASLCYLVRPPIVITVNYGQLAAQAEVAAAKEIAAIIGAKHEIVTADCSAVGAGVMSPHLHRGHAGPGSPSPEWWPFRNQLVVTLAAARAIALGVSELVIGTVKTDCIHKDGTARFLSLMSDLLHLQEGELRLSAPALGMTSEELARKARIPSEVIAWTHSCHTGNFACGRCRGCIKHLEVRRALGNVSESADNRRE